MAKFELFAEDISLESRFENEYPELKKLSESENFKNNVFSSENVKKIFSGEFSGDKIFDYQLLNIYGLNDLYKPFISSSENNSCGFSLDDFFLLKNKEKHFSSSKRFIVDLSNNVKLLNSSDVFSKNGYVPAFVYGEFLGEDPLNIIFHEKNYSSEDFFDSVKFLSLRSFNLLCNEVAFNQIYDVSNNLDVGGQFSFVRNQKEVPGQRFYASSYVDKFLFTEKDLLEHKAKYNPDCFNLTSMGLDAVFERHLNYLKTGNPNS